MEFDFGLACADELEEIAALYDAASASEGSTWGNGYPGREEALSDIEAASLYRLRCSDGRLIGAVTMGKPDPDMGELELGGLAAPLELSRFALHPDFQGMGLAGLMLDDLLGRAAAAGSGGVVLLAARANAAARGLYKSRGFTERGELHRYGIDFIAMRKIIG